MIGRRLAAGKTLPQPMGAQTENDRVMSTVSTPLLFSHSATTQAQHFPLQWIKWIKASYPSKFASDERPLLNTRWMHSTIASVVVLYLREFGSKQVCVYVDNDLVFKRRDGAFIRSTMTSIASRLVPSNVLK
jgi:hypothetical protein